MPDSRSATFPLPDPLMMAIIMNAFGAAIKDASKKIKDEEPEHACSCCSEKKDEKPVSPEHEPKVPDLTELGTSVRDHAKGIDCMLQTLRDAIDVEIYVCDFKQIIATSDKESKYPLGKAISDAQIIHMLRCKELPEGSTICPIRGDDELKVVADSPIEFGGVPQGAVMVCGEVPAGVNAHKLALAIERIISNFVLK